MRSRDRLRAQREPVPAGGSREGVGRHTAHVAPWSCAKAGLLLVPDGPDMAWAQDLDESATILRVTFRDNYCNQGLRKPAEGTPSWHWQLLYAVSPCPCSQRRHMGTPQQAVVMQCPMGRTLALMMQHA